MLTMLTETSRIPRAVSDLRLGIDVKERTFVIVALACMVRLAVNRAKATRGDNPDSAVMFSAQR